jgi:hypothetical protein
VVELRRPPLEAARAACDNIHMRKQQMAKSPPTKTSSAKTPGAPAAKVAPAKSSPVKAPPPKAAVKVEHLTEGQRAYEAKRAAKAGMSLDKWMDQKARERAAEEREREKAAAKASAPAKKPGFFARLIERAHKPL